MATTFARLKLPDAIPWPPSGSKLLWTLVGALAVPLWATWPLLAALTTTSMPLFQYLAIIFATGALLLFALPASGTAVATGRKCGTGLRASRWLAAIMVAVGLLLSDVLFIIALRHIPAAEANLILYLWPVIVVILAAALGLAVLRRRHIGGVVIGLAGAALVIGGGGGDLSWIGAGLAAGGGLAWALFVVFRLWQGENAPDALSWGLALSAVIAFAIHLLLEDWVAPTPQALIGTALVGIAPLGLGNLAWDHGVRKGNRLLLATLAYATPLVSALFLIAAGLATPTLGLLGGAALIVTAGVIAAK
ncbi:DMT family transporter [Hypericibacter sp.]|uniref:DMT family transporter n=1 Tax=Hypericibacter sp. TaxID=2705401 RepID=UPI003D6D5BE6